MLEGQTHYRVLEGFATFAAITAAGIGYLLRTLLGNIIARVRPYEAGDVVHLLNGGASGYSFPSGHATAAFAIACAVLPDRPVLGLLLLIAAFLVSAGRVMVGVHYPLDVVGGAILGALVAGVVRATLKRFRRRVRLSHRLSS